MLSTLLKTCLSISDKTCRNNCQAVSDIRESAPTLSECPHLARDVVGGEAIDETLTAASKVRRWLSTMRLVLGGRGEGAEASKLGMVVQHLASSNVRSRFDVDSLDRLPVARTVGVVQAANFHLASYRSAIRLA